MRLDVTELERMEPVMRMVCKKSRVAPAFLSFPFFHPFSYRDLPARKSRCLQKNTTENRRNLSNSSSVMSFLSKHVYANTYRGTRTLQFAIKQIEPKQIHFGSHFGNSFYSLNNFEYSKNKYKQQVTK